MSDFAKRCKVALALALPLLGFAPLSSADVVVGPVEWQTMGENVRFHARFSNNDPNHDSGPVSGQMNSQPFGAFVATAGPIGTFNIPPMVPDSFFDVFFDVPLANLPPSAETRVPWAGGSLASGGGESVQTVCPTPTFWNGNVDMFWTGPGGTGAVGYHFGQLLICPGAGCTYIHVIMDCQDPAGISWNFSGLCPGWNASLVVTAPPFQPGGPAPNPIPPGFFDGWICISADASVAVGSVCNPALNLLCGNQPATINVSAEACDCGLNLPVKPSTWGEVKALFGNGKTVIEH